MLSNKSFHQGVRLRFHYFDSGKNHKELCINRNHRNVIVCIVYSSCKHNLTLGSNRGSKIHRPHSLPDINAAGTIKGSSSKLHRLRWVRRWISKSFDIHRPGSSPNHLSFLWCQKRCKDWVCFKYPPSNFSLYFYHMEME